MEDATEAKEEILRKVGTVISVVRFFGTLGAILGASVVGGVVILCVIAVSDHYDQAQLRKESDWMMPRITQLWYFGNKEPTKLN